MAAARAADGPPVQAYSGPATIELGKGYAWLDVPVGCSYIVDAADVRRYQAAVGSEYDPDVLAVLQFGNGPDLYVSRSTDPVDEADWRDAPGPAWKQHLLDDLRKHASPAPKPGEPATPPKVSVLGWAAEPVFAAGPLRRMRVSALLKDAVGEMLVMTVGMTGTATREVSILAFTKGQDHAAVGQQVDTVLAGTRFEPPATLQSLKWVAGPKQVPLPPSGMVVNVPAGFVCLTDRSQLESYCGINGFPMRDSLLAAVAPAGLNWTFAIDNAPNALGNGVDNLLEKPGAEAWLEAMWSDMKSAYGSPTGPTATGPDVVGYQSTPVYHSDGSKPRSLYLPFILQMPDGSTQVSIRNYVAATNGCVLVTADITTMDLSTCLPQFQMVIDEIEGTPRAFAVPRSPVPSRAPPHLRPGGTSQGDLAQDDVAIAKAAASRAKYVLPAVVGVVIGVVICLRKVAGFAYARLAGRPPVLPASTTNLGEDEYRGPMPPPVSLGTRTHSSETGDRSTNDVPWYRRNGWMTLMVGSPVLVSVAVEVIAYARSVSPPVSNHLPTAAYGFLALLMPVVLVLLVTGPVFGGRDRSGRWPASTKGLAIVWTAVMTALVFWKVLSGVSVS